ncbi:MAG: iron transporter [Desulfarculales bacterium]|nr:iron transporter [Desulfarculales bacterium]
MKKMQFLLMAGIISVFMFASLAWSASAPAPSADTAGFEEFPLGDEQEAGPLNVAGVYFQPVDMEPAQMGGLPAAQADMHLEADISALEGNDLGYGVGDFVPYLTVKYRIQKEGSNKIIEGNFMPMNASDGPHYGNNVKLDGAGKYKITFIIENPERQGYLLHVDKETGVTGRFWSKPLEVSWDFDFIPRSW